MPKKSRNLFLFFTGNELVVLFDAHPIGAVILAITFVLVAAIDAWAASRKKR